LKKQFGLNSLKGFGVENLTLGTTAAGAILFYLEQNQNTGVAHLCSISRIDRGSFVWMDRFTFRNLEIFQSSAGGEGTSLLDVIDKCSSPLGARMLRSWLAMPLKDLDEMEKRHSVVDTFVNHPGAVEEIQERLSNIGDLERIVSRAAAGKISPREIVQLKRGLEQMEPIKSVCTELGGTTAQMGDDVILFNELYEFIGKNMLPDPANAFGKGDIIADGVNEELDELRRIARHGKEYLLQVQQRESERTGIPSLKISYNNVFGYYIEVRNTHKDKVPQEWIRKQTLVNAERYITQELKEYEEKILGAEEKISSLEQQIYQQVVMRIQKEIPHIQKSCNALARIDCLAGFAQLASERNYCKPQMNDGYKIEIEQGRHPVIETLMEVGEEYVANDIMLDNDTQQVIILTGPNMAGKSALLRQTALIVLMAQIGSFVPASSARIGFVDKIFTRVGASDNISRGESTFMVEMTETSTILHNISERSLILLDEIGRGTSTFDGMSIAWAIVEYIHQRGEKAKTLFATHYHELNELEEIYPRVKNYHISVKEVGNKIIFLRKLCPGGVAHSFGIHVARLAGMPQAVIDSAQRTLNMLEKKEEGNQSSGREEETATMEKTGKSLASKKKKSSAADNLQLSFFQLEDPLLCDLRDSIKAMDINTMSPLDAFDAIRKLKEKLGLKK
ncbi:MAG: DNA mismatch repair protein MutS, partial [Bacteroidales bacterium]|nr:DNA mismatch repair protein MutS [Bacteroidales bacterium]